MNTPDNFAPVYQNETSKSGLPLEIILSILECSISCETWWSRATQLSRTLLISRAIYTSLLKFAYSTIVLKSVNAVHSFLDTLATSPNLAGLVLNLWVADPQLRRFDVLDDLRGVMETKLPAIIAATSNLKRIALPYAYFPRSGLPGITHLSTTNDLFPPTTPFLHSVKSLYIDGLPDRDCVNTIISRFSNVQRVVISVHPSTEAISNEAFVCVMMMRTFTSRIKSLVELEVNAEAAVSEVLRLGIKRTLEKDPRIRIRDRNWQLESEAGLFLCDIWLRESQMSGY